MNIIKASIILNAIVVWIAVGYNIVVNSDSSGLEIHDSIIDAAMYSGLLFLISCWMVSQSCELNLKYGVLVLVTAAPLGFELTRFISIDFFNYWPW